MTPTKATPTADARCAGVTASNSAARRLGSAVTLDASARSGSPLAEEAEVSVCDRNAKSDAGLAMRMTPNIET